MIRMYGIKLIFIKLFRGKSFVPLCLCAFVPFSLTTLSSCGNNEHDSSQQSLPASVTFAVFGNTGMSTDNGDAFKALASSLTNLDADFAVDLGNKIPPDSPTVKSEEALDENYAMVQAVTVPVYPVAGAHDIFDYESDTTYSMLYGPMWYSFRRGGARCIVLNTADDSYRSKFGSSLSHLRKLHGHLGALGLYVGVDLLDIRELLADILELGSERAGRLDRGAFGESDFRVYSVKRVTLGLPREDDCQTNCQRDEEG